MSSAALSPSVRPRLEPESRDPMADVEPPDIEHIVTENDDPVDNLYSEKQQRALTEPLYANWGGPPSRDGVPRDFLVAANVGLFPGINIAPLVPDAFLSLDVKPPPDLWEKRGRTYFFWEYGKAPELVIEVVSNREGGELDRKHRRYAEMGIAYYVVWDPAGHLGGPALQCFERLGATFQSRSTADFPDLGLRLVPWEGEYEGAHATWLRWCHLDGEVIATGAESSAQERARADEERARADAAQAQADAAQAQAGAALARAEQLAAQLRALGVDPDAMG